MTLFDKKVGARVKGLRIKTGLSQQELANKMKISRVSLSQIENGERKVCAQEITELSKIFNISTDMLLNLEKDIVVKLEESNIPNQIKKEEMRISVPQKNLGKFKEALLYILNKVGSKPNIGETVIYKLLYFIDFNFYEKYEEQFIGATYIKNHYGPTPKEFHKIIETMENRDLIKVKDTFFRYPQTKYLPKRAADLTKLNAIETNIIDDVLKKLSDMTASQISDYSHNDVPWLTTEDGQRIDYEKVFYRTQPYSVRIDSGKNI